jgi:hypothetical protein
MKLGKAFASLSERLRKLDSAVAGVETLLEQKLHEKKTGKPSAPATRGDVRATSSDRRKRAT